MIREITCSVQRPIAVCFILQMVSQPARYSSQQQYACVDCILLSLQIIAYLHVPCFQFHLFISLYLIPKGRNISLPMLGTLT